MSKSRSGKKLATCLKSSPNVPRTTRKNATATIVARVTGEEVSVAHSAECPVHTLCSAHFDAMPVHVDRDPHTALTPEHTESSPHVELTPVHVERAPHTLLIPEQMLLCPHVDSTPVHEEWAPHELPLLQHSLRLFHHRAKARMPNVRSPM